MNLGFVVHNYNIAEGTGGYVVRLVEQFSSDHDITVYAREVHTPLPHGVSFVHVPAFGGPSISTILSFPNAFEKVRLSHDVVHAQGWVARKADVVTTHIVYAAWRQATKQNKHTSSWGEKLFGKTIEERERRLVTQNAEHVIAPSMLAKQNILDHYKRRHDVHVIPHGFNVRPEPATVPEQLKAQLPQDGRMLALYAGDARKGLTQILDALPQAPDVHLLVASHSKKNRYLSMANARCVLNRVTWLGAQPHLEEWITAVDVLVHPTIYDTFGLVAAEAMTSGVPVIVSDKAGIAELIEHRSSGWIVPEQDTGLLSEALNTLVSDPALRNSIGQNGKAVASARSWAKVAEETLAVYDKVCST